MIMEVTVRWINGMQFVGKTGSGHTVVMDTSTEFGGENMAPTPMELLLVALGGCTGMDVMSILRKMEVRCECMEINIRGERSDEHPRVFKKIELAYRVKGKDIPEDKVKRAVELSQEKYCSISAMLKRVADITYRVEIENNK